MIINKSVRQPPTDRETTQWSTRLAFCEIADGQAELGGSRGIARKHRDSSSTPVWTLVDYASPLSCVSLIERLRCQCVWLDTLIIGSWGGGAELHRTSKSLTIGRIATKIEPGTCD